MAISSTPSQTLKHRVFTCLTKLSDRDTHSIACSELESIARTLDTNSFPIFLSCIYSTDASDKSPVRKQCVQLFGILSETHGNALSPYLGKILSSITRRLRDPDSSVRSACVNSVAALAFYVTKPPFSDFLKPLTDALFTEQDVNSQSGSALCLASAIDSARDPDTVKLGKLLPRFEKLLKCKSFKAKAALLTLLGSVIGLGGASGPGVLENLVPCLVEFLSSEDWAARKSGAEALTKLAVVERDKLLEFKSDCLKKFETRRFDKVKAVRDVMSQMLEEWRKILDVSNEDSPPPHTQVSSNENSTVARCPARLKNASTAHLDGPQLRKKPIPSNRSSPSDKSLTTTSRKRSPLCGSDMKTSPAMFQKLDRKKHLNWKLEVGTVEGELKDRNENIPDDKTDEGIRISKLDTKRALFNESSHDKRLKFGGLRSGSRVAPFPEEKVESNVGVSNNAGDLPGNGKHRDSEDLSSIRNQLVQIEKQQSSLLDLLQKFIGSSQNGMCSLETRVHGLELALDEISYDLARSTGRMTNTNSSSTTCCLLPRADFLSSKFWRKTEGRYSSMSRFSTSAGIASSMAALRYRADRNGSAETFRWENRRVRLQDSGAFISNPLAEIYGERRGSTEVGH